MRGLARGACVALALVVTAVAVAEAPAPQPGRVRGALRFDWPQADLARLGPIVVFLEPAPGESAPRLPLPRAVEIQQKGARFLPAFRVAVVGQTVEMPNADAIYHNVFSYSRPNDFDLGLYPAGESRSVTFEHAGVVKLYCSIHENMNGTIFVAPLPLVDVARKSGRFEIEGVPPGRYRLRTWSEKLPDSVREIRVEPGKTLSLELPLVFDKS